MEDVVAGLVLLPTESRQGVLRFSACLDVYSGDIVLLALKRVGIYRGNVMADIAARKPR